MVDTMTDNSKKVHQGRNVKSARFWKGVKQADLGSMIGMEQSLVSDLEKKEKIEKPLLQKIAKALDVDLNYLETFVSEDTLGHYTNIEHQEQHNKEGNNIVSVEKYEDNSIPFSSVEKLFNDIRSLEQKVADMRVILAKNNIDYDAKSD